MKQGIILCVDDETMVLESLQIQLSAHFQGKYLLEFAESAEEAWEIIEEVQRESKAEVIVIVSDWLMPGMKGDEFLVRVHRKFPYVIKVLLTGQADESAIRRAQEEANLRQCLYKPWDATALVATIEQALSEL